MNIMNKVTLRGLKKNKTRTIVTIIGVILSAAMITAVTSFISSLQSYVINYTIAEEGDWYGVVNNANKQVYNELVDNKDLKGIVITKSAGYAMLKGSTNEFKPYLHILEMEEQAFKTLPVHLISGRLPQNDNEVMISEHIYSNGGVNYAVGDTLNLDIGQRVLEDGTVLGERDDYYLTADNKVAENILATDKRKFTVVGICERLSYEIERFSAPGYIILTKLNTEKLIETDILRVYAKANKPKDIYSILGEIELQNDNVYVNYNHDLLRYLGFSNDNNLNRVLYGLASILIILIMVGSISLIYNSFAISVSERKKQFGLLSGAGATSRQRRNSVFFESLVIAGIGIPFGIIAGIAGIGTTLYLLRNQMTSVLGSDSHASLSLSVSVPSVIIAIIVALITILISAYIPARRSTKISAMDAIRQTADIKLTAKQVRTSKLTRKLFGMEGNLALKNLKRNRRRYRSTVISLFISVVLFISASAFGMYLKDSVMNVYEDVDYDLSYSYYTQIKGDTFISSVNVFNDIIALDGVKQGSNVKTIHGAARLTKEQVEASYYNKMLEQGYVMEGTDLMVGVTIYSVDHATFTNYILELGLDEEQVSNKEAPAGVIIDKQHFYNMEEKRYNNTKIMKDETLRSIPYFYWSEADIQVETTISIGAFADKAPFGVPDYSYNNQIIIIIDDEIRKTGFAEFEDEWRNINMYFSAKDPSQAAEDIKDILITAGMTNTGVYNVAEDLQSNRNIITIISVFSYGFILLISLITIANVFNTISTNVNLRRREFAMLKSVGMTNRGFNKMLNYECIFYGLKALFYGLPVSVGVTYLIYLSIENGVDMPFYLPVNSILISILSVFLVVFISMMYSMSKIRSENILDALKNENL